ncbi:MAG: DinB family protein [Anaerolineae bacterium]
MNAQAFRHFYDYHFYEYRKLWKVYITSLPQELFIKDADYSLGSVRNHIIHLINVEEGWFTGLRKVDFAEPLDAAVEDRNVIRARWDQVVEGMQGYLANLRDEMIFEKPYPPGEDENIYTWQALLHVVNHGTDHRAQILRVLHDLGVETYPQDYAFYVYENPLPATAAG